MGVGILGMMGIIGILGSIGILGLIGILGIMGVLCSVRAIIKQRLAPGVAACNAEAPALCVGCMWLLLAVGTLACEVVEYDFAHAHGLWCDFDVFVLLDVFEGLFEAEYDGGDDAGLVVGT